MNIYKLLAEGGGYNLPFLLHIYNEKQDLFLINDNKNLTFEGQEYTASAFDFQPKKTGESVLNIELVDSNKIINILEDSRLFRVDAVGVLQGDEVTKIETYKHKYGVAEWDAGTLKINLKKDDRLNMTFPALIFNNYNNRGNS